MFTCSAQAVSPHQATIEENRPAITEAGVGFFLPLPFNVIEAVTRATLIKRDLMPVVLDESVKKQAFLKSIKRAKNGLGEKADDASVALLSCFEDADNPISTNNCDTNLRDFILSYLFESAGQCESPYAAKMNPKAGAFIESHSSVVLRKDMHYKDFESVIQLGRIGRNKSELGMTLSEFDSLSNMNFNTRLIARGSFLEMFRNLSEAESQSTIHGENPALGDGVRVIFKPEILKRLDYHLSIGWPGGMFLERISFTPYELELFYDLADVSKGGPYGNRDFQNEVLFRHPISLEEVQSVIVRPHYIESVKQLLKSAQHEHITVESFENWVQPAAQNLSSTDEKSAPFVDLYRKLSDLMARIKEKESDQLDAIVALSRQFLTEADPMAPHFCKLIEKLGIEF